MHVCILRHPRHNSAWGLSFFFLCLFHEDVGLRHSKDLKKVSTGFHSKHTAVVK